VTTAMSEDEKSRDPSGEASEIWAESVVLSGVVHWWSLESMNGGRLIGV
jgi:hypothetical protein